MKPTGHHAQAAARMAADDRLVQVHLRLRAGSLEQLDAIAGARGCTRSEAVREAVGWLIAREAAWMARRERVAAEQRADDQRRAAAARLREHDF